MTREAYLKHKDLIEAWANGAEIEVLTDYRWGGIPTPSWYEDYIYRIKPKPKQTIAKWLEENNSDYVPDWHNRSETKYYIYEDTFHTWNVYYDYYSKTYGTVYMSQETAFKLVDLLNRGEVVE